jgi:histidyl-tRNA synthetase
LDDKIDGEKDFVKNAPKINQYLSEKEKQDYETLKKQLDIFNIKYEQDDTLVRGLDYYTGLVFEFFYKDSSALGGGGRYGKLLTEFGGQDLGCIGFAFGIERLIMVCEEAKINFNVDDNMHVVIVPLVEPAYSLALKIQEEIMAVNQSCVIKFEVNKIKNAFSYAESFKPKYIIIIGQEELKNNTITIKNQQNMKQIVVSNKDVIKNIK